MFGSSVRDEAVIFGSGRFVGDRSDAEALSDMDCKTLGCNCGGKDGPCVISVIEASHVVPPGHGSICHTKVFVADGWNRISLNEKRVAVHLMRLCTYWMPLLLNVDTMNEAFQWATHISLLNTRDPTIVSKKILGKIEILEAVLRALEGGSYAKDKASYLIFIATSFREQVPDALEDALRFLEEAGEPDIRRRIQELGHKRTRYAALSYMFIEFIHFIVDMGKDAEGMLQWMDFKLNGFALAASEHHKKIGNDLFQERKYQRAVLEYTRAIQVNPENHIAFSNRALCHTRCQKFLEAAVDAKRATLIEPCWAKGHYRYCEALFLLGEVEWASRANSLARSLCGHNQEGVKDLEQQYDKFMTTLQKGSEGNKVEPSKKKNSIAETLKKTLNLTKPEATNKATVVETQRPSGTGDGNGTNKNNNNDQHKWACKAAGGTMNKQNQAAVHDKTAATKEPPKTPKKKSTASKDCSHASFDRSQFNRESLSHLMKAAHTHLIKRCYYNADTSFKRAVIVAGSFTADEKKELGFSALDMQLLLYGRVSALTEIGKPQELEEARKLLEEIKSYEERLFHCLVSYAYGRICLKEKNFAVALERFQDSMQMVRNGITPGKLTWPQTKEIVKETDLDHFKEILEDSIYLCKFPPGPDGTCRYEDCASKNIYITDPDFKGFVELKCSQKCLIEYHNVCWKAFKPPSFDKSEKPCLTPDCSGIIDSIKIIDATGLTKHVLVTNRRAESPRKVKVNQKPPTCVKKLKEKNRCKKENNDNNEQTLDNKATVVSEEIPPPKTNTAVQTQQNAWVLYQDRVLVQVSQMMPLLRQEKALAASDVSGCLKPWLQLDSARGNRLAAKMLDWQRERLHTLEQAVELLLERKNRVWARVFIQLLSNTLNVNVELSRWAGRLNDADLKAAKSFVERNADHLDELDLTPLLTFAPVKEIISENSPPGANLISSDLTKYAKQAPPHEMRLFIWTLEEHRDVNSSFNILLDEYFVSMIDGHCSVLKKSDNQNNFPVSDKSRGRKKKKEPKVPFSPGWENDPANEWEQEDPIYFLHPGEPFSIPRHLRAQVAEFEEHFNGTGHTRDVKKILDNNPDPTVENLYDYFAQILEEHGPLRADDALLQGQMGNFPPVARAEIRRAGGFERFLLRSLRFVSIGGRVGLAEHAVALQRATRPFSSSPNLRNVEPDITFHMDELLPPIPANRSGHAKLLPDDFRSLDLYACEVDESWETYSNSSDLSLTPPEVLLKKNAEVQTYQAVKDCVAVNTEPLRPYERLQGDINKTAKRIQQMSAEMRKMANDRAVVDENHKMTLASLENDIQEIRANVQVTDKELNMFQQKLEQVVKKDQKEKKANQEMLKALKMATEKFVEERASLTKRNRANKASYDEKLNRFLELSNQSAAEKMSLEDEIKRCRSSVAAATRRSLSAQLSMLESSRDQRLYGLRTQLADAKTLLGKLDEYVQRYPSLEVSRQNVRAEVQELEQKIAAAEIQYKEQVEQVKRGQEVKDVLGGNLRLSLLSSNLAALNVAVAPPQVSAPAAETLNAAGPSRDAGYTVFEKAMENLATIFPEYTRSDLMKFFKDLRSSNGGSLSNMSLQDVLSALSQLILDHKEAVMSGGAATPLDPSPIWQKSVGQTPLGTNALNLEDPCIICQEDISPPDRLVLECRHAFHKECITSWLNEKSTCPTCRKDTMFKEFPLLPSRRRQAP